MAKNSSDSSKTAQAAQVIRATGDLSGKTRWAAIDQNVKTGK